MDMKKEKYQKYTFYTVKNGCGLEIVFCDYGASIYTVKYKNHVITYHEDNYGDFLKSKKYGGKTLGRVSGRIAKSLLVINNKKYRLETNELKNTLHGGKHGIAFKKFDTTINENEEAINVVFKYTSPHLECGFPYEVRFIIVYSLSKKENKFSIHYHALSNGLTPINMAPHIYWRLGDKNVLNHYLTINANEVTKTDKELIIRGKTKVSKIYDFRKAKKIGIDVLKAAKDNPRANGYDCAFILNKTTKPQITLKYAKTKLSIQTDNDIAQVYTNCFASNSKMKSYGKDVIYGGVAIEPQLFKPKLIDEKHPFDQYITFHLEDC